MRQETPSVHFFFPVFAVPGQHQLQGALAVERAVARAVDASCVTLEKTESLPQPFFQCLVAGARAFPPEDSGGIGGYIECLEVATGKRKDAERAAWLGAWHPERFNLAEVQQEFNRRVAPTTLRRR